MNPIETAILPMKAQAIERAEKDARAYANRLLAKLEAGGWNLDIVAPRGNSFKDGHTEYKTKQAKRAAFFAVTETAPDTSMKPNQPHIVKASPKRIEAFVETSKADAAVQYDAFVAKLNAKIGETTDAKLDGSHVWGYSILTVTLPTGETQRWKTQQIVNVSVLGNLYNQWPSRKVK